MAVTPPMTVTAKVLGAIIGDAPLDARSSREIVHYVIEEGDTIESLAERFGVSVNTILWANELSSSAALSLREELIILPASGTLHLVRPHDTLSEIALWYKADLQEILEFNELDSAQDIFVGDFLIIPGGRKPAQLPSGRLTPLANSYFIYPVPRSYRLTQGLHPFNAVDLSNGACGGPAYAAAGGIVQQAGYHGVAGNYVRILHPNGVVTFYGHLSGQAASPGERVLQGQIVGYVGHSGYTIPAGPAGCHLHFEVRGAANPFAK
jgi:murein DD-endopeptidase MepM/ murein hydrolase activator NlpD